MDQLIRFNGLSRVLHWLVAALIVLQFVSMQLAERAEHAGVIASQLSYIGSHKSTGMTILAFALVRLCWRLIVGRPSLPNAMPSWQKKASGFTHTAFYLLLFLIPITGWLGSSASAYSVSWYGFFTFPDLISSNSTMKVVLFDVHEFLVKVLFVLVLVHVVAALIHYFKDRDFVLQSMLTWLGGGLFVTVLVLGVLLQNPNDDKLVNIGETTMSLVAPNDVQNDPVVRILKIDEAVFPNAPRVWKIDYTRSYIRFSGEQLGAKFEGEFLQWEGDIRFDVQALDRSVMQVVVDLGSVDTKDAERDSTLLSDAFFNVGNWPQAVFRASGFELGEFSGSPQDYSSSAELVVKNIKTPLRFIFSLSRNDSGELILRGRCRLDRVAMSVGTGEWSSIDSIGQYVDVEVQVTALIDR